MKLLLDANLSPRLVTSLSDLNPNSSHVFDHGDIASNDYAIWDLAKAGGYLIATKDTDFLELSLLYGAPPKVVLLRTGNVPTARIETLLRLRFDEVRRFATDPVEAVLMIDR